MWEQRVFVIVYDDKFRGCGSTTYGIMTVLAKSEHESDLNVQCGTLGEFHRRLGHLCYETIFKMAQDPASGIKRNHTKRESCLACAQGKQTKTVQSNKDTSKNAPIDFVGEVICYELKGSIIRVTVLVIETWSTLSVIASSIAVFF